MGEHPCEPHFTPLAQRLWESIPSPIQRKVLDNVWCRMCGKATTMVKYSGQVKQGDLLLTGICATCGEQVVRLLETNETAQLHGKKEKSSTALDKKYPYLSAWVKETGSIEIGYTNSGYDQSFLRVIQYTDLIWSSNLTDLSLDDVLSEMEAAIAQWCEEQGITLGEL